MPLLNTPLSASRWAPSASSPRQKTNDGFATTPSTAKHTTSTTPTTFPYATPQAQTEPTTTPTPITATATTTTTTAPASTPAATPTTSAPTPTPLPKLHRLLTRLTHKAHLLRLALHLTTTTTQTTHSSTPARQFTLDFFEFYTLLERALVLLLALAGGAGAVSASLLPAEMQRSTYVSGGARRHRFHAAVLEALEREACPLREALGEGEARRWLGRAKEWRNRWKEVDGDEGDEGEPGVEGQAARDGGVDVGGVTLWAEELEEMLEAIGVGLARAEAVVARRWAAREGGGLGEGEADDCEMEDAPWDVIDDVMEWDGLET